jgi:hypothetical protein
MLDISAPYFLAFPIKECYGKTIPPTYRIFGTIARDAEESPPPEKRIAEK